VSEHYFATPAHRCLAPGRAFQRPQDALRYAREAADAYRVAFAVWRVLGGRLTMLERVSPGQVRA
jgi:hypothetical protein